LQTAKKPGNEEPVMEPVQGMLDAFVEAMRNDFNTSGALGVLSKPLSEVNALLASGKGISKAQRYLTIESFVSQMNEVAEILGCFGQEPQSWLQERRDMKAARTGLDVEAVQKLLVGRQTARAEKDWAAADQIRDQLAALGVKVQDGPEGSTWSFI